MFLQRYNTDILNTAAFAKVLPAGFESGCSNKVTANLTVARLGAKR